VQVERIARHVSSDQCIVAPGLPRSQLAALEYFGRYRVDATASLDATRCNYLFVLEGRNLPRGTFPGWEWVASERRPTDRDEATAIFRRTATPN
jgi:hypothetical protein